jgi:hypothetical protein
MEFTIIEAQKREVDASERIKYIKNKVNQRLEIISNNFKNEINKDYEIKLHFSLGSLKEQLYLTYDSITTFCAIDLEKKQIHLIHPDSFKKLSDNMEKNYDYLIDYFLYKIFLSENYKTKTENEEFFEMTTEILSKILSNNFQSKIVEFDIKNFKEETKYTKKRETYMILYVLFKTSKENYIFELLEQIYKEANLKKTLEDIYKKNLSEFVTFYQEKLLEEEKKMSMIRGK